MKLAFISPTKYLERLGSQGDIEFCLAHIALRDPKYREYYELQSKKGRFVILDNGEHERQQVSYDELVDLAVRMQVSELIIPDELYDGKKTIKKAEKFLSHTCATRIPESMSLCLAVQGENFKDWKKCFMFALFNRRVNTVGLTFDIPFGDFNAPTKALLQVQRRLVLLEEMSKFLPKPVHLLGLSDPIELLFAKQYSFVRSNDSSSAVYHAFKGIKLTDKGLPKEKARGYLNFNANSLSTEGLRIARSNIQKIRRLAQ